MADPVSLTLALVQGGSTLLGAYSGIQEGKAAERMGKFTARQLRQKATQEVAVSQRLAKKEREKAALVESRARALAAASGGAATDKGVMDIITDIQAQGDVNALTRLAEGIETAKGLELQAEGAEIEGRQAKKAARTRAITGLLGEGVGMAERYGFIGGGQGAKTS
jgi:hypothetical protein